MRYVYVCSALFGPEVGDAKTINYYMSEEAARFNCIHKPPVIKLNEEEFFWLKKAYPEFEWALGNDGPR